MKIYWSDPEGAHPPKGAKFLCVPFFSGTHSPFSEPFERISTLPVPQSIRVLKRTFFPSKGEWICRVKTALAQNIPKVVLARCEHLELEQAPDPFALAAALREETKGNAHVFCFSAAENAFLGASPERLFHRKGRLIYSEAIAGTRRRGATAEEDDLLGKELFASAKDRAEHRPVQEFLRDTLAPLCVQAPRFTPISVKKTPYVQHLFSRCEAVLREGVSDADLLARLHPTPALLGTPRQDALSLIRELEPFERGLYGGVVGWHTEEASDWVVAIRSCQIKGSSARLYAGAGIVADSDPEEEWEELNHKTRLYRDRFPGS